MSSLLRFVERPLKIVARFLTVNGSLHLIIRRIRDEYQRAKMENKACALFDVFKSKKRESL